LTSFTGPNMRKMIMVAALALVAMLPQEGRAQVQAPVSSGFTTGGVVVLVIVAAAVGALAVYAIAGTAAVAAAPAVFGVGHGALAGGAGVAVRAVAPAGGVARAVAPPGGAVRAVVPAGGVVRVVAPPGGTVRVTAPAGGAARVSGLRLARAGAALDAPAAAAAVVP
jgi:hypothetical protein